MRFFPQSVNARQRGATSAGFLTDFPSCTASHLRALNQDWGRRQVVGEREARSSSSAGRPALMLQSCQMGRGSSPLIGARSRPLSSMVWSALETGPAERIAQAEGFDAGVIFGADGPFRRWPLHMEPGRSFRTASVKPRRTCPSSACPLMRRSSALTAISLIGGPCATPI